MVVAHYLKREYETIFVHRFGNETMPFKRVFINSIHYWGTFGALVGYFFLHPLYTEPNFPLPVKYGLIGAFALFQFLNFKCHTILRDLWKPGTNERGIPKGWGFGLVSCANYFYETLVWLSFSVFSGTFTSYLFLLFSFYQMTVWALQKHARYRKDFKDYPKNRKAIVPFVI